MKTKKILAGACASMMLAVAAMPVVSAADTVSVKVGSAEAEVGGNFSVNIDLADIPAAGINACDFGIKYDSSVITITDVKLGELAKEEDNAALEGVNALETNLEDGFVSLIYGLGVYDATTCMKGEGTFLVVSGSVKNTAKAGDKSDVEIVAVDRNETSKTDVVNTDIIFANVGDDTAAYTLYTPTITNGVVTVKGEVGPTDAPTEPPTEAPPATLPPYTGPVEELVYGDVDLNKTPGETGDLVKLVKYRLDSNSFPLGDGDAASQAKAMEQADVQYDKKIDINDVQKLIEVALGNVDASELGPQ